MQVLLQLCSGQRSYHAWNRSQTTWLHCERPGMGSCFQGFSKPHTCQSTYIQTLLLNHRTPKHRRHIGIIPHCCPLQNIRVPTRAGTHKSCTFRPLTGEPRTDTPIRLFPVPIELSISVFRQSGYPDTAYFLHAAHRSHPKLGRVSGFPPQEESRNNLCSIHSLVGVSARLLIDTACTTYAG